MQYLNNRLESMFPNQNFILLGTVIVSKSLQKIRQGKRR